MYTRNLAMAAALACAPPVAADSTLGLPIGRTADLSEHQGLSVEAGIKLINDTVLGGRANYSVNESAIVYGDVGFIDGDFGADGVYFGAGLFYQLPPMSEEVDLALRGSIHAGELDAGRSIDYSLTEISIDLVGSPTEPLNDTGIRFYGAIGLDHAEFEFDDVFIGGGIAGRQRVEGDDTDLTLGGGALMPLATGEAYASIELIGGFSLGAGYRLFLQ